MITHYQSKPTMIHNLLIRKLILFNLMPVSPKRLSCFQTAFYSPIPRSNFAPLRSTGNQARESPTSRKKAENVGRHRPVSFGSHEVSFSVTIVKGETRQVSENSNKKIEVWESDAKSDWHARKSVNQSVKPFLAANWRTEEPIKSFRPASVLHLEGSRSVLNTFHISAISKWWKKGK